MRNAGDRASLLVLFPRLFRTAYVDFLFTISKKVSTRFTDSGEIDRHECRRHFELNFTAERMARDYVKIYQTLVDPKPASLSRRRGSLELDGSGIVHPQYYIATTSSPADDRARVLKYGRMFFVFDRLGDVQTRASERRAVLRRNAPPFGVVVKVMERPSYVAEFDCRDQQFPIHARTSRTLTCFGDERFAINRGALHLVRSRFLWRDSCFEKLQFVNHGLDDLEIPSTSV